MKFFRFIRLKFKNLNKEFFLDCYERFKTINHLRDLIISDKQTFILIDSYMVSREIAIYKYNNLLEDLKHRIITYIDSFKI